MPVSMLDAKLLTSTNNFQTCTTSVDCNY